jgi:cysteine-rich repeat protein
MALMVCACGEDDNAASPLETIVDSGLDDDQDDDTATTPVCGDGEKAPTEECDDGNTVDTDSCTSECEAARCGDGIVGPGEASRRSLNIHLRAKLFAVTTKTIPGAGKSSKT